MAWILVVDDEYVLVEMIASLIEDLGLQTLTAANGDEALHYLLNSAQQPALVISDVMMPGMNGIELTDKVKQHPGLSKVPVILMSAAGKPLLPNIADAFIHKPFHMDAFTELIRQYATAA